MNMYRVFQCLVFSFFITVAPCVAAKDAWRLELHSAVTCEFTLSHIGKNTKLKFSNTFEPCDSVLEIVHYPVSNRIAIVDAPSERGGSAYIVHAHGNAMKTLKIAYRGSDEDSLNFSLQGNNLKVFTTQEEINLVVATDGSIKIKSRKHIK